MLKRLVLAIGMTLIASSAFAGVSDDSTLPGFKPSKSVSVGFTPALTDTVYAIASKHLSGNKIYGTTSATTKMYQTDGEGGTALVDGDVPTPPTSTTDDASISGWGTAM